MEREDGLLSKTMKNFHKYLQDEVSKNCVVESKLTQLKLEEYHNSSLSFNFLPNTNGIMDCRIIDTPQELNQCSLSTASTLCSSIETNVPSYKNIYDEINSDEFQSKYFLEQYEI